MQDRLDTRLTILTAALALSLPLVLGACKGDSDSSPDQGIHLHEPAPQASTEATRNRTGRDTGGTKDAQGAPAATTKGGAKQAPSQPDKARAPTVAPPKAHGQLAHNPGPTKPSLRTSAVAPPSRHPTADSPSTAGAPAPTPREAATDEAAPANTPPPIAPAIGSTAPAIPAPTIPAPAPPPPAPDPPPHIEGTRPGPAAREEPATKLAAPPALDVEHYLPLAEVRNLLGQRRMMPAGPLPGVAPSANYNSARFTPPGKDTLGATLQVWIEGSRRDVNERYRRMRRQYPNAEETRAIESTKAFYSYWGPVQSLTLMDTSTRTIVSVACDEKLCSQKALLELAKVAKSNL